MLMQHISCGFLEQACQLKTETITYEEKEQQLVNDCVKELSMSFYYFKILFEVVWFKKRKKKNKTTASDQSVIYSCSTYCRYISGCGKKISADLLQPEFSAVR